MSRVEINSGGRHIIVDHDGELGHLADTARQLWDHAAATEPPPGPAVGFSAERRYSHATQPSSMRAAPEVQR